MMSLQTHVRGTAAVLALGLLIGPASAWEEGRSAKPGVLWTKPAHIPSRDLIHGQGGPKRAPWGTPFQFVEEDLDGNSPKFVVTDRNGVRWKVKVGREARPETVMTRFVWAVGYSTDEDYFVPLQQVRNMPAKLKRGSEFITPQGTVRDGRWERLDRIKKGQWKWADNPFKDTRELNGLRVLMAMFNNYDMKDAQNSIYEHPSREQYVVSDLGATLGPTGSRWPMTTGRGELVTFRQTDFIKKVTRDYVDFAAPSWPMLCGFLPTPPLPYTYIMAPFRLIGLPSPSNVTSQRWIGKRVPLEDVRWIAGLLAQLTPAQIRSAFRSAHYPPAMVEGFALEVERRIAILNDL